MPKRTPGQRNSRSQSKTNPPTTSTKSKTTKGPSARSKRRLTLRDRLGHLTYSGACRLLGSDGEARLRNALQLDVVPDRVTIVGDTLRAAVVLENEPTRVAYVTICRDEQQKERPPFAL